MRILPALTTATLVTAALAACHPARSVTPLCDPAGNAALIGRNIGEVELPPGLPQRIISPGDTVTEDYRPNRINVYVDEKGWIARITCG